MTAPYFSRVRLKRTASVGSILPLLLGRGDMKSDPGHRLIWSLFATDSDQPRDFLWREMESRGTFNILSARRPQDNHNLFDIDEPKLFTPVLTAGDRLRFSLRANPVVRRRDAARKRSFKHDVVMDQLRASPKGMRGGHRFEAINQSGFAWLEQQGNRSGFKVHANDVKVDGYRQHRIPRRRKGEICFSTLDFDGLLEVQDPATLINAVTCGFGASKAFGCGLMLLRKA